MSTSQMTETSIFDVHPSALSPRVVCDGKDLGFTVADMLPERRWAVSSIGHTIHRLEFAEGFRNRWMQSTKSENPAFVPIPNIIDYVSQTRSPDGKLVPIGWTPAWDDPIEVKEKGTAGSLTPEEAARRDAGEAFRAQSSVKDGQVALILQMVESGVLTSEVGLRQIAAIHGKTVPGAVSDAIESHSIACAEEEEPGTTEDAEQEPAEEQIRMMKLPAQVRRVWELRHKSDQEIADVMGLSKSTVGVYRMKARNEMAGKAS